MSDTVRVLQRIADGDPSASDELLPLVYAELRRLAEWKLSAERADHTLQPTALVHEAYLRLVGPQAEVTWDGRPHFFAAAAESMRRILIESARRKKSLKRGGDLDRIDIDHFDVIAPQRAEKLMEVDDALAQLEEVDPLKASLVKLRFYVGLSVPEAADALGISVATANRHWAYAKAWLQRQIEASRQSG